MKRLRVYNARRLITETPTTVTPDESLEELVLAITEDPKTRSLFVVDGQKRLKGVITLKDIVRAIFSELTEMDLLGYSAVKATLSRRASDLIEGDNFVCTKDEDTLESALTKMLDNGLEEIPVVDTDTRVIGELDLREMLIVWLEKMIKGKIVGDVGRGGDE
ncbi:MAG TPA: CBS domain-containing protein [Candidatus Latescibacteria bacterium]|nr:CBS domain-containing protein [Candidatus Latescibacterota bacterium]